METRVEGTQFELGSRPFRRNSKTDWQSVWIAAQLGDLESIPPNVRVVNYRTLKQISADHAQPRAIVKQVYVFWGYTGTGKSRRAWDEAGMDSYPKDPRSKFWFGYTGQRHVVLDEFRGGIDAAHLLRYLDRYPQHVETKGGSRQLLAESIWITSNLDPDHWYPDLDEATKEALRRRFTLVVNFNKSL